MEWIAIILSFSEEPLDKPSARKAQQPCLWPAFSWETQLWTGGSFQLTVISVSVVIGASRVISLGVLLMIRTKAYIATRPNAKQLSGEPCTVSTAELLATRIMLQRRMHYRVNWLATMFAVITCAPVNVILLSSFFIKSKDCFKISSRSFETH